MSEVWQHSEHAATWDQGAIGKAIDFQSLFAGWSATVDWPGCTFYRELMEAFPDANVLLNVRDPNRWYESCLNTIYPATIRRETDPPEKWQSNTPDAEHNATVERRIMINHLIWERTFQGRFEDRAYAIDVFNRHVDEVKWTVPADRLLVFEASQGWGPLCAFLGLPVPDDTPFPRLNDTAAFQAGSNRRPETDAETK
jgi:hypothetical protein